MARNKYQTSLYRHVTNRLRILRAERGWSQSLLSQKMGLPSRFRYWQIEVEEVDPTAEELAKLCKLFRCEIRDIYPDWKVPPTTPTPNTDAAA